MRWAWVRGSAAVACAVVALAPLLGDLEKLSWIAGAGSFIIAVPTLVVALTQSRAAGRSRPGGFPHPPPDDGPVFVRR